MRKLKEGDPVFAYLKGKGYVGYGIVTAEAQMIRDFEIEGKPLLDLDLKAPDPADNAQDPLKSEWVVGVDWKKAYPRSNAQTFKGIFANQNIVCKLRDSETLTFLKERFSVPSNP